MKKELLVKGAYLLFSTFASCSSDIEGIIPPTSSEEVNKVIVNLPKTEISSESRVHINIGSSVEYNWESTDILGIFPEQGYQVAFPLNTSSNSNSATFEGGGWGLLANTKYAAYYPFDYDNKRNDSIPITYLGQKQVGNANTSYADNYNFMAAHGSKPSGGTLNFIMQRLGRLIILKFNVPEPTTLTSVKLMAPEKVFITKGYFNLWDETLSIKSTEMSYALNIDLENITTTTPDEEVTVYFFIAPVDLSGKTLTIEATDIKGNKTLSTVAGKDMTASKAFALTGTSTTEVEVTEAGTLQEKLGDKYLNTVSLRIKGELNGTDIALIRSMLDHSNYGKLINLNMKDTKIVAGGNPYYSNYTTTDDIIGDYMFSSCHPLQSIILPKNIKSISKYAFANCYALSNITIPNTVCSIGENAFNNTALIKVTIPDNVKSIGTQAFSSCNQLKSIKLGSGISTINNGTFNDCSSLEEIELPYNITSIGENAFYACMRLSKVKIHGKVTSIGHSAFIYCSSLKTINLPICLEKIGTTAFKKCKSLEEITLPANLTTINHQAFYDCTSLKSVTLSPNLSFSETTNTYIFAGCTSLSYVIISSGIKIIPQDMFRGCISLKEVTIPSSVTTIGGLAFYQSGLEKVYIHCTTPPTMITSFYEIPSTCVLYVPKGCVDTYKNSIGWNTSFSDIKEIEE